MSIGLVIAATGNAIHATAASADIAQTENARTAMAKAPADAGFCSGIRAYFVMVLDHAFFAAAWELAIRAADSVGARVASAAICQDGLACMKNIAPNPKRLHKSGKHRAENKCRVLPPLPALRERSTPKRRERVQSPKIGPLPGLGARPLPQERLVLTDTYFPRGAVKALVSEGRDVNATDSHLAMTPLHYAAAAEHLDVVRFLISRGANVNAIDKATAGDTPLGHIAQECSLTMAKTLLDAGANPLIPGMMQITLLQRAERRKCRDGRQVYELLLKVARSRFHYNVG